MASAARDMGIYATMPTNAAADARALLAVAPDQYVTERARLVKQARADGDREAAKFFQTLKRPGVSLWAVLAAAADVDDVNKLLSVTEELGGIQAGGSNAGSLTAATQSRRKAVEAFVDRAVKALGKFDPGADKRRPEIRGIVDQLSRHPDLAEAWTGGTLREMPDDEFGFGAFEGMEMPSQPRREKIRDEKPKPAKGKTAGSDESAPSPKRDLAGERAGRAKRAEETRQARKEVVDAARELTAAERQVELARSALRKAERELQAAEDDRGAATERHDTATARLAASQERQGSGR